MEYPHAPGVKEEDLPVFHARRSLQAMFLQVPSEVAQAHRQVVEDAFIHLRQQAEEAREDADIAAAGKLDTFVRGSLLGFVLGMIATSIGFVLL